jgi:CBS domain-containing protein
MVPINCPLIILYRIELKGRNRMANGNVIVREAMKANPVVVSSDITVQEAAVLMRSHKVDSCFVGTEKPLGIVTERDIVQKVVAENLHPSEVTIDTIMTTPIVVIDPFSSLQDAMEMMGKCSVRRLPVIEHNRLIGVVTQKDILQITPVLKEISHEWYAIKQRDETYFKKQMFSGKCEDCGMLSAQLRNVDGRLLCEDCIDALRYE